MKFKSPASIITFSLLLTGAVYMLTAQNSIADPRISSARQGLETFKKLSPPSASGQPVRGSKTSLADTTLHLGVPIEVYLLQLNDLKEYKTGQTKNILTGTGRIIYPILAADGSIVSSEELELNKNKWETRGFGNKHEMELYSKYLATTKRDSTVKRTFLVRMPAFNLQFLGVERSGQIFLTYINERPFENLTTGLTLTLDEAVRRVQPKASRYNGLPK